MQQQPLQPRLRRDWLSWSFNTEQNNFAAFAQRLIAFRTLHPALRPPTWYSTSQLQWYTPAGTAADTVYWNGSNNHAIAWEINGTQFGDPAAAIYIAYNGWSSGVMFALPSPGSGKTWYRVTDTCNDGPDTIAVPGSETRIGGQGTSYSLCGQALLLLIAK